MCGLKSLQIVFHAEWNPMLSQTRLTHFLRLRLAPFSQCAEVFINACVINKDPFFLTKESHFNTNRSVIR